METRQVLPAEGFVRLNQILGPNGPIPLCKASWYNQVREGRAPAPVKLGPRASAWRVEDIREYIRGIEGA